MKTRNSKNSLLTIAAMVVLPFLALTVSAQTAPQLSYGVPQVLQLSQAKVSDSTIIAYIQNSGNSYGLDANQIIYLRQQGVSDAVINTMLTQPKNVAANVQTAPTPTADQPSTAVVQPTVTYVQSAPASSVYVVPDTQTYYYDSAYYQPYYYPYYGYPAVSLSFGFGGGWGGYYGGGYHGGGGWHGGGGGFHGGGGGWHH